MVVLVFGNPTMAGVGVGGRFVMIDTTMTAQSFFTNPSAVEPVFGLSSAFSFSAVLCGEPQTCTFCNMLSTDISIAPPGSATSSANAISDWECLSEMLRTVGSASASTTDSGSPNMQMFNTRNESGNIVLGCGFGGLAFSSAAASMSAQYVILEETAFIFEAEVEIVTTIDINPSCDEESEGESTSSQSPVFTGVFVSIDGVPFAFGVRQFEDAIVPVGFELENRGGGVMSGLVQIEVDVFAGPFSTESSAINFQEVAFDRDGDDRFGCGDIAMFEMIINDPKSDYILALDLNADGVNDEDDLALLTALLGAGFGSGIVGDANGDCEATCDDLDLLPGALGATFSDPSYIPAFDVNMDGVIDTVDEEALLAIFPSPADINRDGVVDGADLALLLAAFGTDDEQADINGDGVVDGADLAILLASFGATSSCS